MPDYPFFLQSASAPLRHRLFWSLCVLLFIFYALKSPTKVKFLNFLDLVLSPNPVHVMKSRCVDAFKAAESFDSMFMSEILINTAMTSVKDFRIKV